MPTLAEKKATVEEITERLQNSGAVYVTNYSGMSVAQMSDLRHEFYKENIKYTVYKNTLMKRAMDEVGGYEDLETHLVEQNAFAFVEDELAMPAKILKKFVEDNDKPVFKAALIEGDYYDGDKLGALASMKSKSEVIGDIVGLLLAPVSNVVSGLQAQGETIAGAVKQIAEKED
ncbi:MAG: 50S ribosomal protein L10 [Bacteroidota bacterium]